MTQNEALRLALEALEKISRTQYHIETPPIESLEEKMRRIADKAITAIKAALEAKDEPVAQPKVRTGNCLRVGVCASEGHKIQPQRTWVGLTGEEKIIMSRYDLEYAALIGEVERKLKEKNT